MSDGRDRDLEESEGLAAGSASGEVREEGVRPGSVAPRCKEVAGDEAGDVDLPHLPGDAGVPVMGGASPSSGDGRVGRAVVPKLFQSPEEKLTEHMGLMLQLALVLGLVIGVAMWVVR